jgi:hypothetical protein
VLVERSDTAAVVGWSIHGRLNCQSLAALRTAFSALVWILGASLAGIVVAELSDEHGSILFVGVGLWLGAIGAVLQVCFAASSTYRAKNTLERGVIVGLSVAALTLGLLVLLSVMSDRHVTPLVKDMQIVAFVVVTCCLIAPAAASTKSWRFRRGNDRWGPT